MAFSIERFVSLSRAVETADLDWDYIARVGVTDDEARVLRYMADVESHTIIYLRDLLAGHTSRDGEITAFMSCWVYEEFNHGRAIDLFLTACGRPPEKNRYENVTAGAGWQEELEAFLTVNMAKITPHFAATHMAWGAINEMTAASAYTQLAYYTQNRELTKLLLRLSKDERRHQSFYYHQAEKRMYHPLARFLCKLAMNKFWSPVGMGVGEDEGIAFIGTLLYADDRGYQDLKNIDRMMAKLPGLEGFDLAWTRVKAQMDLFERKYPERAREIRAKKRENQNAKGAALYETMLAEQQLSA